MVPETAHHILMKRTGAAIGEGSKPPHLLWAPMCCSSPLRELSWQLSEDGDFSKLLSH